MNKDLQIAKKTIQTEIQALKKLSASFNRSSQFSRAVSLVAKIKDELHKMLIRESRLELYENSIKFLKTRIKLDQSGFSEDIFQH